MPMTSPVWTLISRVWAGHFLCLALRRNDISLRHNSYDPLRRNASQLRRNDCMYIYTLGL